MLFVDAETLRSALSMRAAIDALETGFGGELPDSPPRQHLDLEGAEMLLMPARSAQGAGVKLVTVNPANPARGAPLIHAVYVLFGQPLLDPVAILDGAELTALRTGAVSGLATRYLARDDARRLLVFGTGVQAHSHVDAMAAVRDLEWIGIVGQSPEGTDRFVAELRSQGRPAEPASPASVTTADIICTCTTSSIPLFDGASLREGTHVNAVGAHKPDRRELDTTTIARAGLVVVETRGAAETEAGELVLAAREGRQAPAIAELSDVVTGRRGRTGVEEVTVFKSVGVASEDLIVAQAVLEVLGGA